MYLEQISESLTFHLQNVAFLSFDLDSDYEDIISPFTRMYLVTEGSGSLIIGNKKISLEAGKLYLIPSFTSCSYHFGAGLSSRASAADAQEEPPGRRGRDFLAPPVALGRTL